METSNTIEAALRQSGQRLYGFRSGGGLRVFRLGDIGYGEAPTADEALVILAEDLEAGGRPYSEVYGVTRVLYLTGQSTSTSQLDAHLLRGNTIDVRWCGLEFVAELSGWAESRLPPDLHARALTGETVVWADTGRRVAYRCDPSLFSNGEPCYRVTVVSKPSSMSNIRTSMWRTVQRGVGGSLLESIDAAFAAEAMEVED